MAAAYDDVMPVRRIAVVAYHSSPLTEPGAGDAGGMTVYVRALAERLAWRGLRTDIFTRAASEVPTVCGLSPGVRVVSLEGGPRRPLPKEEQLRHVGAFSDAVRAFAMSYRIHYDLVHSHYWQSGLVAKRLARSWGIPLVHSQHTLGRVKNRHLPPGDRPEPARRLEGEDEVIRAADILVASTDDEWHQLSCLYGAPHDSMTTLHPGVDHALFAPGDQAEARAALDLPQEAAVLLFVGRIQPLKGLDLAIEALARLRGSLDRDVRLVVVGGPSGPSGDAEVERLRALAASRGVLDHIRLVGPQPHARLPLFYRGADALVMCSHSESFGLAALEAHACGTPVVATAVGGLAHIVADGTTGFLVAPRDAGVFAGWLRRLLCDEGLARSMSRAALARSASFSWEITADSFMDLYECVVREESPEVCTC
jgi:D-inositol-3-phosphate glycosyltransferase